MTDNPLKKHTGGAVHPISKPVRLALYTRMVLGAGLLGIALGYYLQMTGHINMTLGLAAAFFVRGMIVGAFVWAFELFGVLGPRGNRLAGLPSATRFAVRIVAYLILGEAGYWLGEAIFTPADIADLFDTANGP